MNRKNWMLLVGVSGLVLVLAVILCSAWDTPSVHEGSQGQRYVPKEEVASPGDVMPKEDVQVLTSVVEAELKRRMPLYKEWLMAAAEVADLSGDEEAKQTFYYMATGGMLAAPVEQGFVVIRPSPEPEATVVLVPLIEEDAKILPNLVHHSHAFALYLPEHRSIVLRTNVQATKVWKGIVFLHESAHAMAYGTKPYDHQDVKTFCEKERDVHTFQNRLVEKIGGKRYRVAVAEEIESQKAEAKKLGDVVGHVIYGRQQNYPIMDDIFGPPLSEVEADFRATQVWIHAAFTIIDETFPAEERENRKALFLKVLYAERGMFDPSTGRLR